MNDRMEKEISRTIQLLQASMPELKNTQTSMLTLLRVSASEMNIFLFLGLFTGVLIFGVASVKVLSMPMLSVFCTAPMPMLLLFHRYVLTCNHGMRELEETLPYSYAEMLTGRTTVISCYMLVTLVFLSLALHHSAGEGFLRLALCGAIPSLYLCALLLLLSSVIRNQESISMVAIIFWAALCFSALLLPFNDILQVCSTSIYAALAIVGVIVYGICFYKVKTRRYLYVFDMG